MRLTCPNCGAQYDVPDAAIPEAGREVQCSACGEAWAQHRPEAADTAAEQEAPPAADPAPAPEPPARRRLDPEVADILRTEAARERARRAAESTGDVGTHAEPAPAASRQATLPDPGNLTSSLTASPGAATRDLLGLSDTTTTAPSHSGFLAGFWVALIACALAAGVYLAAPDLVALVPEAEAPIERYVTAIDDARLRLDALVDRAIAQISGG